MQNLKAIHIWGTLIVLAQKNQMKEKKKWKEEGDKYLWKYYWCPY